MIWVQRWTTDDPVESALVSQLTDQIGNVCGPDIPLTSEEIRELARAVAVFVRSEEGPPSTDSRSLAMLASRALESLGQQQVARRLLVFGTGLVQPAEWIVSGEEAMWVLDLRRMTVLESCSLELVFFRTLHLIIDSVAEAWDPSMGSGVLGLRYVTRTASSLLGKDAESRLVEVLADEIKTACSRKLEQLRDGRGWRDIPFVMDLDL